MLSLIITVKNELENLPNWLESIERQNSKPDEIIVVDGMSTDGTWDWLQGRASDLFKVFQKDGNIASGRNFAIRMAKGNIIVATDAGCVYKKDWLLKLRTPVENGESKFVATAFYPWLKEEDSLLMYLLAAATTPGKNEFDSKWLPSSRSVAFTKQVWKDVAGYPEWIPFCEDIIFDFKIEKHTSEALLVREPLVGWRPRKNFFAYFRQLFNYTRSDAHGKLFYMRQMVRYVIYGILTFLFLFALSFVEYWIIPVLVAGFFYMLKFWVRFLEFAKKQKKTIRIVGLILLPFVIAIGDIAKMVGWIFGLVERWVGKIKYEDWK